MEIKEIIDKNIWENFLLNCQEKTFLDSWNWGEFQKKIEEKIWRWGIYDSGQLIAVALIIKIKAKRGTFLFVPHGPIGEHRSLKILLEKIKELAEKEKASFIRIAPIWERKEENIKNFDVDKKAVQGIFNQARKEKRLELGENESRKILEAYKIEIPLAATVKEVKSAREFTKKTGYPVVLKIDSPDILHKTDVGGIKVGIRNDAELEEGFNEIMNNVRAKKPEAFVRGISIQEMIQEKQETIIGINKDPQFGPMIMFGLGGIYVEILKDVSFRIAPITERDAKDMIEEIKTIKLLKGARGAKPSDINSIVETLLKVSQLVTDFPEIMEMDINPLFVREQGKGSIAGDVRIRIE